MKKKKEKEKFHAQGAREKAQHRGSERAKAMGG